MQAWLWCMSCSTSYKEHSHRIIYKFAKNKKRKPTHNHTQWLNHNKKRIQFHINITLPQKNLHSKPTTPKKTNKMSPIRCNSMAAKALLLQEFRNGFWWAFHQAIYLRLPRKTSLEAGKWWDVSTVSTRLCYVLSMVFMSYPKNHWVAYDSV